MRTTYPGHRRAIHGVVVIVGLVFAAACESDGGGPNEERWTVVQAYLDRQAAWEEDAGDIRSILMTGTGSFEDQLRGAEEAHGPMPDATAAVEAARAIIAEGGPSTVEAAEFLIERWRNPRVIASEMQSAAAEAGLDAAVGARLRASEDQTWDALIAHIVPDWSVVQGYVNDRNNWRGGMLVSAQDAGTPPRVSLPPSAIRAVAVARAILNAGGEHPQTVEAAEFLTRQDFSTGLGDDRHRVAGARALVEYVPNFDGWPDVLRALDRRRYGNASELIDAFLEETASGAEDPVLRAGARYYVASGLMHRINEPFRTSTSPEDRAELRERALVAAMGLSRGLESETFDANVGGTPPALPTRTTRTFADAEAELVANIRFATLGGTLPELTGRRIDGREEPLSAYRGRVLLIDFWATWCVPCIVALPELRTLVLWHQ